MLVVTAKVNLKNDQQLHWQSIAIEHVQLQFLLKSARLTLISQQPKKG